MKMTCNIKAQKGLHPLPAENLSASPGTGGSTFGLHKYLKIPGQSSKTVFTVTSMLSVLASRLAVTFLDEKWLKTIRNLLAPDFHSLGHFNCHFAAEPCLVTTHTIQNQSPVSNGRFA